MKLGEKETANYLKPDKTGKMILNSEACRGHITAVKDALYVLNGKWKLPLIATLGDGPQRFNEIQRAIGDITPKILSKELKELELNEFVERIIYPTTPVTVVYQLTPYSQTLGKVLEELRNWGTMHRKRIVESMRNSENQSDK